MTISIILLLSCEAPQETTIETQPIEEPPIIEPVTQGPVMLATYDGLTLKGYDGIGWYPLLEGNVVNGHNNFYASDQSGFPVLYELGSYGEVISEQNLQIMPDAILKTSTGLEYMCQNIPPSDALAQGGQNKDYVQLWINGTTSGNWFDRQFKCSDIIEVEIGFVFAIDSMGQRHGLDNAHVATFALHGGLVRHTTNTTTRTGYFNASLESWLTNFTTSTISNSWQPANGQWYSANGYIWDEFNGLQQQITALDAFNYGPYPLGAEAPVFHSVGVRTENGEEVLYWLECNTGVLYRYVPTVDRVDTVDRLYLGSGGRLDGIAIDKTINAFIVGEYVYFTDGGSLNRSSLVDQVHTVFVGANLDSWGWN